ncbi:MAG: hypothetical protein ABIC91_07235 [Nanoarchaeota archaeon]|nr:hypothetical protein [Nanoarchaeota archaeon]MBU1030183.1 hypothetical protein [Nanoarchaeota archaeon]MBU1849569.1 hypothetical protein [Nanoarchaeota archaeon]
MSKLKQLLFQDGVIVDSDNNPVSEFELLEMRVLYDYKGYITSLKSDIIVRDENGYSLLASREAPVDANAFVIDKEFRNPMTDDKYIPILYLKIP